jgi:para-nitrobenzyl esterase
MRTGPTVAVDTGTLEGLAADGTLRFSGIPFAAPPVGEMRWRPAAPPRPWAGVRPATSFAPAPVQSQPRRRSIMYQANFAEPRELVMSEDCLYLNVWTPELGVAGLPVLVWVPGGGNRFGWGSQAVYDGAHLARRGVVVVTMSYRLGAFGFLSHPELRREAADGTAGNYGLTDVLAALTWVQRNIAAFGGDPGAVTIFGNSAGAAHISHLMASPLATGLFRRAIAQSGSGFKPMASAAEADADGVRFGLERRASTLAELRDLGAAELVGGNFEVIVDGRVLEQPTRAVFEAGGQLSVPLLAGTNDDEGSPYAPRHDAASFRAHAQSQGVDAAEYLGVYPAATDDEAARSSRRSVSCARFYWPLWKWATTHARTSAQPVYLYRFGRVPPLPADLELLPPADGAGGYGAFHTAELFYMWDNLQARSWPWQEQDVRLATAMADSWVSFATAGDPGAPGGAGAPGSTGPGERWEPLADPLKGPVMRFGDEIGSGPLPEAAALELQDKIERDPRRRT